MEEQTKEQLLARIRELEAQVRSLSNSIIDRKDEYGLRWIDVPEAFDAESENKIPILEEVKELAIKNDDGKPTHILIEGDNYHALQCLNYTHKGKIDVIYIDPPYNTGKEFVYKDKRVLDKFPDGQTIDNNHPLRHSAWLSFMSKRLELAKNLLSERGVIFISIDDNEQANLKLLCDKVFGEENFVAEFIWEKKKVVQNDARFTSKNHEYVLAYRKSDNLMSFNLLPRTEEANARYDNPDNDPKGLWTSVALTAKSGTAENIYDFTFPNGIYWKPNEGAYPRLSKESLRKAYEENRLWFGMKGKNVPRLKKYLSEVKQGIVTNSILYNDVVGSTQLAKEQLKRTINQNIFDTPKPLGLIGMLSKLVGNSSSTILDFFAGSGTTLHATMQLNEEDGGNRQCILVNTNEKNICRDVTYERNRRVMQGYTNAKGEQVTGFGNSLKYYKTAFVGNNAAATATDEDKVALAHKAGNLIAIAENTLEEIETTGSYQIFQNGNQYTAIYFSGNLEHFPKYAQKIEALRDSSRLVKVAAYIYCIGNVDVFESEFNKLTRISLHAIPQPIIEIYKQLNA